MKSKFFGALGGFAVGVINGLFGAGGGALTVPLLEKSGLETKRAHAGAIGVILPITLLSAALYINRGEVAVADALPFLPGTVLGAVAGAIFLKKITAPWLKGLFGALIIFAGMRMALA